MKEYTIKRQRRDDYESMTVSDRSTGDERGEYRLTVGCERSEIASMRRALDRHLSNPGSTLGNYQW
jgi:hypothetical protein